MTAEAEGEEDLSDDETYDSPRSPSVLGPQESVGAQLNEAE
jgi:hypothetical protein